LSFVIYLSSIEIEKDGLDIKTDLPWILNPYDEFTVSYEGCLECGTCMIACSEGAIDWRNPRGGFGVSLRYG
jgi:NAD-dependent dihydropyrimidine dehydrogenase PreA subunit